MEELSSRFFEFIKSKPLPILIGIFGIFLIVFGILQASQQTKQQTTFETPSITSQLPKINSSLGEVKIDIEGAVVKPGVYSIDKNARVEDLLAKAGGISSDADKDWVAQKLNKAAKLVDGQKIYIPRPGETAPAADSQAVAGASSSLISINDATSDQLDSLPGVGPVTAQKIINGRPYNDISDLTSKKVVSQSVFTKIKDLISL